MSATSNSQTTENFYAHFDVKAHDGTAVVIGNLLNSNGSAVRKDLLLALAMSDQERISDAFCQLDPFSQRKLLDNLLEATA